MVGKYTLFEGGFIMLNIYIDTTPPGLNFINDVEKGFASLTLSCTDKEKELVKKLEGGTLVDANSFIDRFGYKLYLSELSTGCKSGLCVLNYKDSVINLAECGLNARDIIISLCDSGNILFDINSATISNQFLSNREINVKVGEYIFTDLNELNDYLFNVYPFKLER